MPLVFYKILFTAYTDSCQTVNLIQGTGHQRIGTNRAPFECNGCNNKMFDMFYIEVGILIYKINEHSLTDTLATLPKKT